MKNVFCLTLLLASLTGCSHNSDSSEVPPQEPIVTSPMKPMDFKTDYKPLSPIELFGSRFKSLDAICDVFISDQASIEDTALPLSSIRVAAFPLQNVKFAQEVFSPSGNFKASIFIEDLILGSWDFSFNDKIISQTPVVKIKGKLIGQMKSGLEVTSNFGATISPDWRQYIPIGSIRLTDEDATITKEAAARVSCRLD